LNVGVLVLRRRFHFDSHFSDANDTVSAAVKHEKRVILARKARPAFEKDDIRRQIELIDTTIACLESKHQHDRMQATREK
jgi:hypothetical protein